MDTENLTGVAERSKPRIDILIETLSPALQLLHLVGFVQDVDTLDAISQPGEFPGCVGTRQAEIGYIMIPAGPAIGFTLANHQVALRVSHVQLV